MVAMAILWRLTFFLFECPHCGFVFIFLLLFSLFFVIKGSYPRSKSAAYWLIPYFVWVIGMTIMNGYIIYANPPHLAHWWLE